MKKKISIFICLLLVLTVLYPAGVLITACFGYRFELISISAFALSIAALSVGTVVLDVIHRSSVDSKAIRVISVLLPPLSLLNALFYVFTYPKIWVLAGSFICVGCCCYLAVKHGKSLLFRILTLVLSSLLALPIGFLCFMLMIFGNIGQNTVIQSVESPSGRYDAQIIDSDQGALGGDTRVQVYETNSFNAILFKIEKQPQTVYIGEWGEFEDMVIHWKDDNCLLINSVEYDIE